MGQHLDASIHEAMRSWMAHGAWSVCSHPDDPAAAAGVMPDNDILETRGGRHLAMGILENKFWLNLREALGGEFPWTMDERFAARPGRQRHKREVSALMKGMFRTRSLAQWCDAFNALDLRSSH